MKKAPSKSHPPAKRAQDRRGRKPSTSPRIRVTREVRRALALGREVDALLLEKKRDMAWRALASMEEDREPWMDAVKAAGFHCTAEFYAILNRKGCEDLKEAHNIIRANRQAGRDEILEEHVYLRATGQKPEPVLTNKGSVVEIYSTDSRLAAMLWEAKHRRELEASAEADGLTAYQQAMQELKELNRAPAQPPDAKEAAP